MSKFQYQCFICKETITNEEPLDPCAVDIFSNIDRDMENQRSQTFFCHYECFKRVNNDDSTIYLEESNTPKEYEEEYQRLTRNIADFSELLSERADRNLWARLFELPTGKWRLLKEIVEEDTVLANELNALEMDLCEPLLVTWMDDYASEQRFSGKVWKVFVFATESQYEYSTTLLVGFEKGIFGSEEA